MSNTFQHEERTKKELEDTRLQETGASLTRLIIDESGRFFDKKDRHKRRPLDVSPIQQGLTAIEIEIFPRDPNATHNNLMNYALGRRVEEYRHEGLIRDEQVGVRIAPFGTLGFSKEYYAAEYYAADFYIIEGEKPEH